MTQSPHYRLVALPVLARRLRVKRDWLAGEADAGRIPGVRAGDSWLFDAEAVERVLLKRAAEAEGGPAND